MEKPLVTIVIPVYNGANYLAEAIDSALNQTYQNCEIIVVNDGSNDEGKTENIALSYGNRIRYFKKENGGVSSALNLGIKYMKGEYFCWLSHDDVFYKEKISKQLKRLLEIDYKIAFCSYDILYSDKSLSHIRLTNYYKYEILTSNIFSVLNAMIQFGGVVLHREIFKTYGVFDESLRTTQDFEFLFRILKKEKVEYVDDILYAIRYHSEQGSNTIDSVLVDADKMYLMFLDDIEDVEKISTYGSVYNYYYQMLLNIWPQRHLVKSIDKCMEHIKKMENTNCNKPCALENYIDKYMNGTKKEIYIFGCGNYGKRLLLDLRVRGIQVAGFIDNNPFNQNVMIDGIMCISKERIYTKKDDVLIIVAALVVDDIVNELAQEGFSYLITKKDIDIYSIMNPPNKRTLLEIIECARK